MTAIILVGVAGVVALVVAIAATRPSAYALERKLEVTAPTDLVFGVLNDLDQVAGVLVLFGSPLEVDKAKLTIEESIPGQKVGMKLEIVAPMKSTVTYALTLAGTSTGSIVTWSMHGNHNFIGRALGMFMNMDKMLGTDIEKGLAQLKTVVEGKQLAA